MSLADRDMNSLPGVEKQEVVICHNLDIAIPTLFSLLFAAPIPTLVNF